MSGEKDAIVNLRRSEYNRMMQTCRRMDDVDSNVRAGMNRIAENLRQDFDKRISAINRRHSDLEHGLSGLSREMHQFEAQTQRQFRAQAQAFQDGLNGLSREMAFQRSEYLRLIQEQGARFAQAMAEQRKDLERQIRSVQQAMIQKEMNERQQADQWIRDTQEFLNLIARNYRHEKFKPGAWDKIQAEMAITKGNHANASYQAALAGAQQSYIRASELRLELEQLEMAWDAHLETAMRCAAEVLAICEAQESCRFTFDTSEGAEDVAGEVDFWTEGALSRLRSNVEAELKRLGAPDALTLDDLKHAISQSETRRQECLNLTETAKQALLASQLRNNIGQTIEAALRDAGWEVTDSAYEREDFRRALHVKLENPAGDEIVTLIQPETAPDQTIRNKVSLSFFDRSSNDETFRLKRLKAITDAMAADQFDVSPPVCAPGTEHQPSRDERKLDFESIRHAKGNAR